MNDTVRTLLALFLLIAFSAAPSAQAQSAGDLMITELMPDPDDVSDGDGEYVELYNDTDAALNLTGVTLTDANNDAFTIGDVTVPGGGFVVLCANADPATNGGVSCDHEYEGNFSLNNGSETVTVTSREGATLFEVSYDDGNAFGAGVALELRAVRLGRVGYAAQSDYQAAQDPIDEAGSDRGSPGATGTTQGTAGGDDVVATRLVFQYAPGQVRPGEAFSVTVAATDESGTIDTDATTQVTLSLDDPGSGTLTADAGLTQHLSGGAYTWSGLRYDAEDTFTLHLSDGAGGLSDGQSTPIEATHTSPVFFTEYVEGSSQNKAVEIYNGTEAAIDLQAGEYAVQTYTNGATSPGQTLALTGTVAPGDVYVVARSDSDPIISGAADQAAFLTFNGNDALALVYDADGDASTDPVILDVIGQIGADPGAEWGSGGASTQDNTLRRRPGIDGGDANGSDAFDPADEWFGYAQDTFAGLGNSGHARTTSVAGWRMLAAPYRGITVQDLAALNLVQGIAGGRYAGAAANLYTSHDDAEPNNNGYVEPAGMSIELGAAEGFIWYLYDEARVPETDPVPFTLGAPAGSTPRTSAVTVNTSDTDQAFLLLGNPYDTAYDLSGLNLDADADGDGVQDFSSVVHIWDPATDAGDNTGDGGQPGSYRTLTRGTDTGRLAVWQGFFAERNDPDGATAPTLTFALSGQQAGAGVQIFSTPRAQATARTAPPSYRRLPLQLTATDAAGHVVARDVAATLFFHEDASSGWDAYDATKLSPLNGAQATLAFISARGAEECRAGECLKAQDSRAFQPEGVVEVPLAVTFAAEADAYELAWPQDAWTNIPDGWMLTLTDHTAGKTVDLRDASSYVFTPNGAAPSTAAASSAAARGAAAPTPRVVAQALPADAGSPRFTLTIEPGALPVEMTRFTAAADGGHAVLSWATASETGSAAFEVQHRAPNATGFAAIGTVEAAGQSTEPTTYRHRTGLLAPGTHAFRLRQIDRDGSFSFSEEVTTAIRLTKPYALQAPYPNPFSGAATLSFAVREAEPVRIDVFNVLGQRVRTLFDGVPEAGERHTVTLRAGGLPSGLYIIRLTGASFSATRRVVLVH